METFFKIIPFLVPILIMVQLYRQYKNKNNAKEKSVSKLEKYKLFKYLKLVFVERANLRPNLLTVVAYIALIFSFPLFIFGVLSNIQDFIYPPLPLEKMETKEGVIKSITLKRKMDSSLVLSINNRHNEEFSIRNTSKKEKDILLNKNVKIWYSPGWSSAFTIDNIIYEITMNNESVRLSPYSYEDTIKFDEKAWNFTKYCFFIAFFSAFIIWIQNRKELPIHRFNRMKQFQKKQGKKTC